MTGSIHVGLAALGAALGVGLIGMKASEAVGRNPVEDIGAIHSGNCVCRSDRVLRLVPCEVVVDFWHVSEVPKSRAGESYVCFRGTA
jgi:ATP synthase subunit C